MSSSRALLVPVYCPRKGCNGHLLDLREGPILLTPICRALPPEAASPDARAEG
jgi:hypothetical protein